MGIKRLISSETEPKLDGSGHWRPADSRAHARGKQVAVPQQAGGGKTDNPPAPAWHLDAGAGLSQGVRSLPPAPLAAAHLLEGKAAGRQPGWSAIKKGGA